MIILGTTGRRNRVKWDGNAREVVALRDGHFSFMVLVKRTIDPRKS
jgi:hypothetical protein